MNTLKYGQNDHMHLFSYVTSVHGSVLGEPVMYQIEFGCIGQEDAGAARVTNSFLVICYCATVAVPGS